MKKIKAFFSDIKNIWTDKQKFKEWEQFIDSEAQDPKSLFSQFRMTYSTDSKQVSYVVELPENYQYATSDAAKYQKLMELIMPVNRYFLNSGWGDYIPFHPDFLYVESELNEEGQPLQQTESCTYIAVWKFEPKVLNDSIFWGKFAAFSGINLGLIGGIVALCCLL